MFQLYLVKMARYYLFTLCLHFIYFLIEVKFSKICSFLLKKRDFEKNVHNFKTTRQIFFKPQSSYVLYLQVSSQVAQA